MKIFLSRFLFYHLIAEWLDYVSDDCLTLLFDWAMKTFCCGDVEIFL